MTPQPPARGNATRQAIIVELLERYDDLVDPMQVRAGGDRDGVGSLMPGTYTEAVRELERLLRLMREDRQASLLRLSDGTKISVRSCWWHLNARYIACTHLCREVPVKRKAKHGKSVTVLERRLVVVAASPAAADVDGRPCVKVQRGIEWLEASWSPQVALELPRLVYEAA